MFNPAYETLLFVGIATLFFIATGWAWRSAKSYELPDPLPSWFKFWFLSVQIGGGLVPLVILGWGIWQGRSTLATILVWYFVALGLQIASERLSLRQFRSIVFVLVPYLYVPYRIWQLYAGWLLLNAVNEAVWLQNFLIAEIVLWIVSYGLALAQIPRLLRWQSSSASAN